MVRSDAVVGTVLRHIGSFNPHHLQIRLAKLEKSGQTDQKGITDDTRIRMTSGYWAFL